MELTFNREHSIIIKKYMLNNNGNNEQKSNKKISWTVSRIELHGGFSK